MNHTVVGKVVSKPVTYNSFKSYTPNIYKAKNVSQNGDKQSVYDLTMYEDSENEPLPTEDYNEDALHEGLKCNVCSSDIRGFRYVCVECTDWDMCGSCEARGAHRQHYVLRLPGPRPQNEVCNVLERIRNELPNLKGVIESNVTEIENTVPEILELAPSPSDRSQINYKSAGRIKDSLQRLGQKKMSKWNQFVQGTKSNMQNTKSNTHNTKSNIYKRKNYDRNQITSEKHAIPSIAMKSKTSLFNPKPTEINQTNQQKHKNVLQKEYILSDPVEGIHFVTSSFISENYYGVKKIKFPKSFVKSINKKIDFDPKVRIAKMDLNEIRKGRLKILNTI